MGATRICWRCWMVARKTGSPSTHCGLSRKDANAQRHPEGWTLSGFMDGGHPKGWTPNEMNRLQKKCFVASAGFHLLLVVIVFVGPAFLSPKTKSEDYVVLDFVPDIVTDLPFSHAGGGAPKRQPPA